jgi:hypothetical protein
LLSLLSVQWAQRLAQERRFFHWELAFPEVFYDRRGQPLGDRSGFDALVGNPPYDVLSEKERQEDLRPVVQYLADQPDVRAALGRKSDLYRLFIAKGSDLLRKQGLLGFIIPMSLLGDLQTLSLRRHILERHAFLLVDAFPQKDDPQRRIFPQAKLPTAIVLVEKEPPATTTTRVTVHPGRRLDEICGGYQASADEIAALSGPALQIPLLASQAALRLAEHAIWNPWRGRWKPTRARSTRPQ